MNAKCTRLSRSTYGGQLRPDEIVSMLDQGYKLDYGQYSEEGIRRAAAEGDSESRWTRLRIS